jgi:cytidine deaminase
MTKPRKIYGQNIDDGLAVRAGCPTNRAPPSGADVPYLNRGFVAVSGPSAVGSPDNLSDSLTATQRTRLISEARKVAKKSYSPYSNFRVGAAVLAGDNIYTGCNIENASLGLTICAERVAIFSAIAAGNRNIYALAISCIDADTTDSLHQKMPCGACRQVIQEFFIRDATIMIDKVGKFSKEELLPLPFTLRINRAQL